MVLEILEVKNLSKKFNEIYVLNNINMKIEEGKIYGIIGANGSGKSTFTNVLNGHDNIINTGGYEGDIYINGKLIKINNHIKSIEYGIAMVHQELALFKSMTVTENIKINRENTKTRNILIPEFAIIDRKKDREDALETLSKIGVTINPDNNVHCLTTNEKQFVEIARELDNEKIKLLMLDEPTSSLNINETKNLLKRLREIANMGIAIIFISHRLDEIMDICDEVMVLRDGELISTYKKDEFDVNNFAKDMVGKKVVKVKKDNRVKSKDEILKYITKDNNVDLGIHEGEIIGITGLAGQGQQVFSEGLFGLQNIDYEVKLKGKRLTVGDIKTLINSGIYYLSDDRTESSLFINSPIWKNVVFGTTKKHREFLKGKGLKSLSFLHNKNIIEHTNKIIDMLNIKCKGPNQNVRELSGGNQQKVCIGRALTFQPEVLFVGEPTRGIDIYSKELILDWLLKINKEFNTTVVVTSGELEELIRICDRIVVMYQGEIFKIFEGDINIEELTYGLYGRDEI